MAAAAAAPPQQQQPSFGQARWVPSLPTSLIASLNPFAVAQEPKPVDETQDDAAEKRPTLSMLGKDAGPPSPTKSTGSIMFAEPESQGTSVSGSREGSIDGKRRSKKSNKPKTSYSICHPPPASSTRHKFHRRPRSLLQLHKITPNSRPLPAFEVIPSANFSVRLTRATAKVFKAKHSLCPSDLVILRAEDYFSEEPSEEQEARDVVALICKGRKEDGAAAGKAKIYMADGQEWEAYPLANGGYEFFTTDEHGLGLTVRWVPKKCKKEDSSKSETKRFNFSTISPNSRRHPIIANLSKTSLAINDTYKMPDPASATPTTTPKQTPTLLDDGLDSDDNNPSASKQDLRTTDPRLRSLITMTSIWVSFREGWSPHFKYDDHPAIPAPSSRRNSIHSQLSTPPASPVPAPLEKRASILSVGSSIFRKPSLRASNPTHHRNSTLSSHEHLPDTDSASPTRSPSHSAAHPKPAARSRADSASTVLVHRAASNRRAHNTRSHATWRPDLLSAGKQEEVREVSREGTPAPPAPTTDGAAAGEEEEGRTSGLRNRTPEPDREVEREAGRGPSTSASASSNATEDSAAAQKKGAIVVEQRARGEGKGRKWRRWIRGRF